MTKLQELIPLAALENHIAVLGKTGSGKSNAVKVIVERLMGLRERVCILDPTGTWWGLRLLPDGSPSYFKPIIFGGEHADLPLGEQHGAVLAEAIGRSSDSAIIDTRALTVGQRTRFFTAFAETLLRTNQGGLTLVIDEAHVFMPQGRTDPQGGAAVHAGTNLVSLGRGSGLRIVLISQRPQKLHKDALTQTETMIAMRLIHNLDVDAVRAWIGEQADPAVGSVVTSSLAGLPTGDAWVWHPLEDWLKRVHFPKVSTFDSGRPPSRDEVAPLLTPIDAGALGEKMNAIRKEAMENDPKRLKARIAELERERQLEREHPLIDVSAIDAARTEGYGEGYVAGFGDAAKKVIDLAGALARDLGAESPALHFPPPRTEGPKNEAARPIVREAIPVRTPEPKLHKAGNGSENFAQGTTVADFTAPQIKVLSALSTWKALGNEAPTRQMVAFLAGYSPKSSGFANLLGALRTRGAITYPGEGLVGLAMAPLASDLADAVGAFTGQLSAPQLKIIDALHGCRLSREKLAEKTGYSERSSGFANLLGAMRSLTLIDYPAQGEVELRPWVEQVL